MVQDLADRFEVSFDDERAVANAGLLCRWRSARGWDWRR